MSFPLAFIPPLFYFARSLEEPSAGILQMLAAGELPPLGLLECL